jgi:hypothetical protein
MTTENASYSAAMISTMTTATVSDMKRFSTVWVLSVVFALPAPAATALDYKSVIQRSCKELLAADYRRNEELFLELTEPIVEHVSERNLFEGNACNIRAYLVAECWRDPKASLRRAVESLSQKNKTGRMPCIPFCGAGAGPLEWSC